jgi:uncharacterized repeat protein (TIGR04076 family)
MRMDPHVKEMLKVNFGLGDDDLIKLTPNIIKLMQNMEHLAQYKFQAEAVSASLCSASIQEGDKFVFSSMPIVLLPDLSTAAPCMRALGVLTPFLSNMADRIVTGVSPNDTIWSVAECMDPGLGNGGFGKVRFRFSVLNAPK